MAASKRIYSDTVPKWLGQVPAYAIGIIAAFWTLERILSA
jgi:hypothetical protein